MVRKIFEFLGVSVVSFCFFTFVFHTYANAQISANGFDDISGNIPTVIPSPTIFIYSGPTLTPTLIPTEIPTPTIAEPTKIISVIKPDIVTVPELETLFQKYGNEYGVDTSLLKQIAKCESGFNPQSDTGRYAGMFQFLSSTWINWRNRMGLDPNSDLRKNAEESIRTAAFMISQGQKRAWAACL